MKIWRNTLIQLILLIFLALVVSNITGHLFEYLLMVCIIFIVRQFFLLSQLESWVARGAKADEPVYQGDWTPLYQSILKITRLEKKRKKKLSNIVGKFSKATATLPDAVIILDNKNGIIWFNNAARRVFGLKKEHKGQIFTTILKSDRQFIDFLNEKKLNSLITVASPLDKELILQIKLAAYEKKSYLLLAHDVTYLKNIERMRTDFVDNISHELRTPLTVLKGYIETLEDMEPEQSMLLSHALTQMNFQTQRMQYLVDDLLLLANLETKKIDEHCVNIASLLTQIHQENKALQSSQSRIDVLIESTVNIMGNEQELRSAFTNLITNALKYSPLSSVVTVKWYQKHDVMVLEVIDQGEGIPAEDINKITERFYRVDVKRQEEMRGTGLGLSIVKHVLTRHDAELDIKSVLNKGSRFKCKFPIQRHC